MKVKDFLKGFPEKRKDTLVYNYIKRTRYSDSHEVNKVAIGFNQALEEIGELVIPERELDKGEIEKAIYSWIVLHLAGIFKDSDCTEVVKKINKITEDLAQVLIAAHKEGKLYE